MVFPTGNLRNDFGVIGTMTGYCLDASGNFATFDMSIYVEQNGSTYDNDATSNHVDFQQINGLQEIDFWNLAVEQYLWIQENCYAFAEFSAIVPTEIYGTSGTWSESDVGVA